MARVEFTDLADGLSDGLGDELNGRLEALKESANEALCFRGSWSAVLDVRAHDLVLHQNTLWEALQDSVNLAPAAGASWRQVLAAGVAIIGGVAYPIQAGAADSAGVGFRTLRVPNS